MSKDKENELSFEEAMEQLEQVVETLEEGDIPLEKAIHYYQEGMKLSKLCHDKLTNVQEQMVQIMNDQGELESFELQEEES